MILNFRGIVNLFQLCNLKKIHVQLHTCAAFWFGMFSVFVDSTVVARLRFDSLLNDPHPKNSKQLNHNLLFVFQVNHTY